MGSREKYYNKGSNNSLCDVEELTFLISIYIINIIVKILPTYKICQKNIYIEDQKEWNRQHLSSKH